MNKQEGCINDYITAQLKSSLETAARHLIVFAAMKILDLPHILKKPEGVLSRASLDRLFGETLVFCHSPSLCYCMHNLLVYVTYCM